ncbi:MAG TPA: type IV secretion system DNA-binding domain-containing protein [Candidatus Paceibacterota bacterium]|nr:type IV secretion system DNA-binding domain-containing protein [Candidatus Paceibacterota bacterium]
MKSEHHVARSLWRLFTNENKAYDDPPIPTRNDGGGMKKGGPVIANAAGFDPDSVRWGMRTLPIKEATDHFLMMGTIGSGKTTLIRHTLQSIAPRFRPEAARPEQLIIFDAKANAIPMLQALGLRPDQDNFWVLNPYDLRSAKWDLGEATREPVMARAIASLLVPEDLQSTARFFSDAAREVTRATIMAMNAVAELDWDLRHLLCALESRETISAITSRNPLTKAITSNYLHDKQHCPSILSTLATKLGPFENVAALWHTTRLKRKFSITEFLKRPGVLVIGNDPVLRETISPINSILLKALVNEILRQPDTLLPRHWFVFDEFADMQRQECVPDLIRLGRSKGASVLLGVQNVPSLTQIYGEKLTNAMLGECANKTFLRVNEQTTAQWISDHFGKVRHIEQTVSESWGPGGKTHSVQHSVFERSMFLPSFFSNLPMPATGGNLVCVSDIPSLKSVIIARRRFDELLSSLAPIPENEVPGLMPRKDIAEQTLVPWTEEERRRFLGDPPEDEAPPTVPSKPRKKPRGPSKLPSRHRLAY